MKWVLNGFGRFGLLGEQGYDWWEEYGVPFTIEEFKKAREEKDFLCKWLTD